MAVVPGHFYFDVWSFDDMLGDAIGELTDVRNRKYRGVDNGMASGSFEININSDQYAWCAPDNLVRVRLDPAGPFEYSNQSYIGAFVITEGSDTIVSEDQKGGQWATRQGLGPEILLERAVIDFEAHYADDIVNHPYDKSALQDGQWHFDPAISGSFVNAGTPGCVLRVLLRNAGAMTPEPITEIDHDFNIDHDTDTVTWPHGDAVWAFDVGTDLLTVLGTLVTGGLYYKMTPGLMLHAWVDQQGNDLSGAITLDGEVIRGQASREVHASPAKSRVLVEGDSQDGPKKYRWVSDAGVETALGVRQGFFRYQTTPTDARLDLAGAHVIGELKNQHDGPPVIGVIEDTGRKAFDDYFPGDTVALAVDTYTGDARIFAITLSDSEQEAGVSLPIVEFNGDTFTGQVTTPEVVSGNLKDPFFMTTDVDFIGGGGERGIRFRPPYGGVGAQNGTADDDAWWLVDVDGSGHSTFEALVITAAGRFADFIVAETGIEGDGDKIEFNVGVGSGHDDDKFYVNDGWGIVIPRLASDPAGGASEEGQEYWNTTSHKRREFDGSIWQDVGAGAGAGFTPVTVYAESNSPGTTSATPNVSTRVPFDTFYDVDGTDLSGVLPAGLGLTYTSDSFDADEDGVWVVGPGVDIVVSPGNTGVVSLNVPGPGYNPEIILAASGNPVEWITDRTVPMRAGQNFSLVQASAAASETVINGYAIVNITRIANSVS